MGIRCSRSFDGATGDPADSGIETTDLAASGGGGGTSRFDPFLAKTIPTRSTTPAEPSTASGQEDRPGLLRLARLRLSGGVIVPGLYRLSRPSTFAASSGLSER